MLVPRSRQLSKKARSQDLTNTQIIYKANNRLNAKLATRL